VPAAAKAASQSGCLAFYQESSRSDKQRKRKIEFINKISLTRYIFNKTYLYRGESVRFPPIVFTFVS
jgi:hypothetical protein